MFICCCVYYFQIDHVTPFTNLISSIREKNVGASRDESKGNQKCREKKQR